MMNYKKNAAAEEFPSAAASLSLLLLYLLSLLLLYLLLLLLLYLLLFFTFSDYICAIIHSPSKICAIGESEERIIVLSPPVIDFSSASRLRTKE